MNRDRAPEEKYFTLNIYASQNMTAFYENERYRYRETRPFGYVSVFPEKQSTSKLRKELQ